MPSDKKMYRVYDTVIGDYVGMPFVANNAAHAKRMLGDALANSEYARHAEDYLLRQFDVPAAFDEVCRLDALFVKQASSDSEEK